MINLMELLFKPGRSDMKKAIQAVPLFEPVVVENKYKGNRKD